MSADVCMVATHEELSDKERFSFTHSMKSINGIKKLDTTLLRVGLPSNFFFINLNDTMKYRYNIKINTPLPEILR